MRISSCLREAIDLADVSVLAHAVGAVDRPIIGQLDAMPPASSPTGNAGTTGVPVTNAVVTTSLAPCQWSTTSGGAS